LNVGSSLSTGIYGIEHVPTITIANGTITKIEHGLKTFVIDHPVNDDKYLVHACLEGPEAGVYYRGKGKIVNNQSTTIVLPDYVSALAYDFTIQITPIYDGVIKVYNADEIVNNQFNVYGENGGFYWLVHGTRNEVNVEPNKKDVNVNGSGPYLWLEN
jgi:hypothetical protein